MSKIIIKNNTKLSDLKVLELVLQVIINGKISRDGAMYCALTIMSESIEIQANLTKNNTQVFTVDNY